MSHVVTRSSRAFAAFLMFTLVYMPFSSLPIAHAEDASSSPDSTSTSSDDTDTGGQHDNHTPSFGLVQPDNLPSADRSTNTVITSVAPSSSSLVGAPYTVDVEVSRNGHVGNPSGTVTVSDDSGVVCTASNPIDLGGGPTSDYTLNCASNTPGVKNLVANYTDTTHPSGPLAFDPSTSAPFPYLITSPITLAITAPANDGDSVSGPYDFTADYENGTTTLNWAIRADTDNCNFDGSNDYAGNADTAQQPPNDTPATGLTGPSFSSMIDTSGWPNGQYCFVVNDMVGERVERFFTIDNDGGPSTPMPSVITDDATGVADADATLNGEIGPVSADGGVSFWVSTSTFSTATPTIPDGVYSTPVLSATSAGDPFSALLSSLATNAVVYGQVPGVMPAVTPDTTYYYAAWGDIGGTWYPGEVKSFTTGDAPDTVPPTVTVTPDSTDLLHGTETFDITVHDNEPLDPSKNTHVWVYLYNDAPPQATQGENVDLSSGHGTFTVDTTALADGAATLDVGEVFDAAGNPTQDEWHPSGSDSYFSGYVIDNTPPVVTVTPMPSDGPLSGIVTFHVTINDAHPATSTNGSIYSYLYENDPPQTSQGGNVDLSTGEGDFTVDTTQIPNGLATLDIGKLVDAAGNATTDGYHPSGLDSYFGNYDIENAVTPPPPSTVTVTIDKFVDGQMATSESANNAAFPMESSWSADNIGSGSGTYTLSPTGYNSPNAYEAITSDMTAGADYATDEVTSDNDVVGASCDDGKPFALAGYSTGSTLEEAASADVTSDAPSFTGLEQNAYVIVWNKNCLPAPTLAAPDNGATTTVSGLTQTSWNAVTDPAGGITYVYQSANDPSTNPDGSFANPAYTSDPLSDTFIPTPNTPPGTYYWHVQATDADGNVSSWSDMWSFTVNADDTGGGTDTENTVIVSPDNMQGWDIANYDGGNDSEVGSDPTASGTNGTFVVDDTTPLGTGDFQQVVGTDGDDADRIRTSAYNGLLLSDIAELQYSSIVHQYMDGQDTYLKLVVAPDGNSADGDDALYFEPIYQNDTYGLVSGVSSIPDQGDVQLNTWQTWNAFEGGFWTDSGENGTGVGGPPLDTLAHYIATHPDATLATDVPAVRIQVGGGAGAWDNYQGNVDDFVIGTTDGTNSTTTTYDFEPADVEGGGDTTGSLTVIKHVVGGEAVASDFTIDVSQEDSLVESDPGNEDGITYDLDSGDYVVSEEDGGPAGYTASFSGNCDEDGDVSVSSDEDSTCTVTNTFTGDNTPPQNNNQHQTNGTHGSTQVNFGGTSGGSVLGASTFNFATNFGYGSSLDPDVTELQKILIADGYLNIPTPTGWFGPLTQAAVKLYQAAHGIITTGYVGPITRAALNAGL